MQIRPTQPKSFPQKQSNVRHILTLKYIKSDGIFKPISIIDLLQTPGWHLQAHLRQKSLLQLGQISWYSSVQSSSTFRYRLAYKPLYIFRFKIIEQGQLSYPKICPPHFYTQPHPSINSSKPKWMYTLLSNKGQTVFANGPNNFGSNLVPQVTNGIHIQYHKLLMII